MFLNFLVTVLLVVLNLNSAEQAQKKICLNMIVRNESKIIERCLNSVKDIVDYISICDTGSTDNTVEIIEKFMETTNIPGKVYQHTWKNFGANRTLSFEAAKQTLNELGQDLQNTYVLLLDADMMFVVLPEFDKDSLKSDRYLLLQQSSAQSYYNTRLIRASLPWRCLGVTHEYWDCEKNDTKSKLTTLKIDDHCDGGCKQDKFERDIKFLLQGLEEEPDNNRYMFYLSQSYYCCGQYEEAIKWALETLKKAWWIEEIWWSKYRIAQSYNHLKQWDKALTFYLQAYELIPTRAEPLNDIAKYYRHEKQYNIASLYAMMGKIHPYPSDQVLFVSDSVYNYRLDEELSISGYYTKWKELGCMANNRLVLNPKAPDSVKNQAYRNMVYYKETLKNLTLIPLENHQENGGNSLSTFNFLNIDHLAVLDFSRFRNPVGPVPFDGGKLVLVHEIMEVEPFLSFQRFLYLDHQERVLKMSRPFVYEKEGVKMTQSMKMDESNSRLVLDLVDKEGKRWHGLLDLQDLKVFLRPLSEFYN